jgi:low affinity Fe/Cu permease
VINVLPLTIESLVAILLLLTILYCVRLNDQLKRLKADGAAMQATIAELVAATDSAERAIAGLKTTVREADETLGERLKAAERFSTEMRQNTAAGAEVLNRLTQIAGAHLTGAEPAETVNPELPGPQAIVAAAQAFADRARARARAIAA